MFVCFHYLIGCGKVKGIGATKPYVYMNRSLAIFIDRFSRPLFLFFPQLYFWAYQKYKHSSDKYLYELLRRLVPPDSTVMDIGAHIGSSTIELAKLVGSNGRVLAFEPNPENVERLKANTKRCPHVEVYPYAVGDRSGTVNLYVSPNLNVDHRMYGTSDERRAVALVKQVALDEFLRNINDKISLVKIDIQGYEYHALLGMKWLLSTHRTTVVMEFWPWGLKQAGASAELVMHFFEEHHYCVSLINQKQRVTKPLVLHELKNGKDDYYDILCQPR